MEIKNIKLTLGLLFVAISAMAQEGTTIIVFGERTVEKASKLNFAPQIIDTNIATAAVNYPLLQLKHESETEIGMINPAAINIKDVLPKLYNSYVKLGVGTELMPLGEFYYDSDRSRRFMYGGHVKHLSSFGNISGYAPAQFDRTGVMLYGGVNERRYNVRGDMHYRNQGLHYYAFPDDSTFFKDSIRQRYSDFGMSGSYASHIKDSAKVNYKLGLEYNNYTSRKPENENLSDWRARENFVGVRTNWQYKSGTEVYAADFDILYNGYKYGTVGDTNASVQDTGLMRNNTIISLHPSIVTHLKNDRFKAKIGLNLILNDDNGIRAHIYPDMEIKYSMFNDIFIPYAGLSGGMKQTTFKSISRENEFVIPNLEMRNENRSIELYGGIKGSLSKRIGFNLSASFANIKNKALYVTDTTYSRRNAYSVIFDTMNVTTFEGSISYQLKEKLKIDGIGRFNSYSLLNNSYAWNLPQLEFILRGSYNLFDKFIINMELDLEQGRRALVYEDGVGVTLENGQYIKELGFIADANLGVEYRYNNRISAFIQFNNFASQQYMRWYNAPVQQFQVLGGVTFKF